jgi:ubiquitin conjugation factor E4 B
MSDTTRVALSDAELQTNALSEDEEAAPYGFICECFFLTARAMHLGYVKCAAEHTSLAREVQDRARQMEDVDAMRDSWAASIPGGPSQFQMAQFERRVGEMKAELDKAKSNYAMFEATLLDPETLGEAARFYRLVAAWLRWVAEGRESDGKSAQERESVVSNGGGAFESLLPNPVSGFLRGAPGTFSGRPGGVFAVRAEVR